MNDVEAGDRPVEVHRVGWSARRWLLWLSLAAAAAFIVHQHVLRWQTEEELRAAGSRLEVLGAALRTELARHETLPGVLALDGRLAAALAEPGDGGRLEAANDYLRQARSLSGAEAIYLIDADGLTIAASNAGLADSFVGQNYAFRPYFADAMRAGFGRFYAIGTTTGRPGYFLASAIGSSGSVRGVLAVKVSLGAFEQSLGVGPWPTVVLDENGVAILAPDPRMRYRSLLPLSVAQRRAIADTRQYHGEALAPLLTSASIERGDVAFSDPDAAALMGHGNRTVERSLADQHWRMVSFVQAPVVSLLAEVGAAFVFSLGAGLALLLHAIALRRARQRELTGREDEIRRRIEAGTRTLQAQLAVQAQTEAMLRATTDAAVQAGKLTVLGQMSAGVSHELNQPLTAMRNFADSGQLLLKAGDVDAANGNFRKIARLSEHMGQIVGHLRVHARKQPGRIESLRVAAIVDAAVQLLQAAQGTAVRVEVAIEPPDLTVVAQHVRVEQVLLNLLRNAIDAEPGGAAPEVRAWAAGGDACIEVRDRGRGIPPDAVGRLFEPFFTTKAPGQGLGLGLAVSKMIVRELGGDLTAHPREGGGACFRVRLPRGAADAIAPAVEVAA